MTAPSGTTFNHTGRVGVGEITLAFPWAGGKSAVTMPESCRLSIRSAQEAPVR
jgi:hypothetical protein